MFTALVLIALSGAPPAVDMKAICRHAQAAALPEDAKIAYQSCLRDEQAARGKLAKRWPHYSASARGACVGGDVVAPSDVELLICLEMQPGGSLSLKSDDRSAAPAGDWAPLSPHVQPKRVAP